MIVMDSKTQFIVDIIIKVTEKKISTSHAAKVLNKSKRTIERYLQHYYSSGIQFVIHKTKVNPQRIKCLNLSSKKFKI